MQMKQWWKNFSKSFQWISIIFGKFFTRKEQPKKGRLSIKGNTKRVVNHFFHVENLKYKKNLFEEWNGWSVKNLHMEQILLIRWHVVWENYSKGLTFPGRVSVKNTQMEQFPLIRRQFNSEENSTGTSSLVNETACQRNLFCLSYLFKSQLSIKKTST